MINKKFITVLLFGGLGIFFFNACTDLKVKEVDSVVSEAEDGGFAPIDPVEFLSSTYGNMDMFTTQDNIYALYDHTSDEMLPPTRGTDWGDNGVWRTLHQHNWDATHAVVVRVWNSLNQAIYKCNQIIASASSDQKQVIAEAKFLRAFYMYYVMDLYGQVPFREVTDGVDVNPRVYTRSDAFDFIVTDLEEALADLPAGAPAATNRTATKAAANTLLARLYLNKGVYKASNAADPSSYTFDAGDMNKVIQYCDAVKAEGFDLDANFFNNFTNTAGPEMIFSTDKGNIQSRWRMTTHYNQNPDGWNGFVTLADFYDKFQDGDVRKGIAATPDGSDFSGIGLGFLIGQQYNDDGDTIINKRNSLPLSFTRDCPLLGASSEKGIRVIKYHPAHTQDYVLFRYADVHLMKAEAIARGGNAGGTTALDLVNELRAKRNATAMSAVSLTDIYDERGRELYWEGTRRIDQIRFGTWDDPWSDKTSTNSTRVLFPIPQVALDSNPNLGQNDGY